MERTPPPQFNLWSQRRKRRGGGNNTSCCTPFLLTPTAIHNKPKQPDRTRKEREREKRHQTHMIDAPGWGGPMFGLGPQQAGDASHLDLHAVPASHCVGRRPLGKWGGGTSIIIIHIIWQEVAAASICRRVFLARGDGRHLSVRVNACSARMPRTRE